MIKMKKLLILLLIPTFVFCAAYNSSSDEEEQGIAPAGRVLVRPHEPALLQDQFERNNIDRNRRIAINRIFQNVENFAIVRIGAIILVYFILDWLFHHVTSPSPFSR